MYCHEGSAHQCNGKLLRLTVVSDPEEPCEKLSAAGQRSSVELVLAFMARRVAFLIGFIALGLLWCSIPHLLYRNCFIARGRAEDHQYYELMKCRRWDWFPCPRRYKLEIDHRRFEALKSQTGALFLFGNERACLTLGPHGHPPRAPEEW